MSLPTSLVICVLVLASPALNAEATPTVRPFPLAVSADRGAAGLHLVPSIAAIAELGALTEVRFTGVPNPGGAALALDLVRIPLASAGGWLAVDGVRQAGAALDADLSLWSGHVVGVPDSEVFLAFSRWGSRGWVRTGGDLLHLLAQPGVDGDWSAGSGILIGERALRSLGAPLPAHCLAMTLTQPVALSLPRLATGTSTPQAGSSLPLLECRVGVETDHEYYQLFGSVAAAQTYALSLMGAVSSRYREAIGVILTVPYLGLHTTSNDGWTTQDNGGNSVDLLYEFQAEWMGGAGPVAAHLYHFLSGADLGGGVAFLPSVCDPDYQFGVSGNLGVVTPFPIAVGPLNWDFIVVAHEIGHNFNAFHTHDYCPPLDQCAPIDYFGPCQTQAVCTSQGTIMSYCHLCDGGMLNETTFFHNQSESDMRSYAETTCLVPFKGVLTANLGFAKAGGAAAPAMAVSFSSAPDAVNLDVTGAVPSKPGVVFLSLNLAMLPFKGGTLVPTAQFMVPAASSVLGAVHLPLPVMSSFPGGLQLYTQAWFKEAANVFAATNGVAFELITP